MKLNEFKKAKLNELDLSSVLGDYGSAAVKTGLGSLMGKNVLSTTDQMAKDSFVKSFNSRAASGLQSAINSGLVDPAAKGGAAPQPGATPQPGAKPVATPQPGAKPVDPGKTVTLANPKSPGGATPSGGTAGTPPGATTGGPKTPEQIRKEKQALAGRVAQGQMAANPAPAKPGMPAAPKTPEQIRQEKQAAATQTAQGQMAPFSKLPADQYAKSAANVRQQKQGAATTAAQSQMAPMSKLPADQFAKSASNVRQQQQGQAATAAQGQMTPKVAGPTPKTPEQIRQAKQAAATAALQGQMNPASKLPADQFNKSADNVRQQQQATATQTAQQQMAAPQGYQSSDPRFPNGKYDGVTGKPTPEYQAELDKWTSDSAKKQKADAAASQTQAKSNDDMQAQNNPAPVAQEPTKTAGPTVVTNDPAEVKAAMQAKLDAMKQKNPKLAAQMADLGMDDEFDKEFNKIGSDKPDNTIKMPKQKKTTPGSQAFGQMAQNLGKVAEGSRFDKLNYLFESIIAEATMAQTVAPAGNVVGQSNQQQTAQGQGKQTISQYITNFFKQFMKGVNISDPTVTTQVATLAKELEQTYAKDKGNSTLPKLADLAWSVSHAQAEQEPEQSTTAPAQPGTKPGGAMAAVSGASGAQQTPGKPSAAKQTPARQIGTLLNKLTSAQKKQLLGSLEKELGIVQKKPTTKKTAPVKKPAVTKKTAPASNTVNMPKIKGAKAGLPTPDEEAKFQQRIQQAQAQQK